MENTQFERQRGVRSNQADKR